MPALSTAFMAKAAHPGGLGDLASSMADGQHAQAYADPTAAQDPATQQKGGSIAGSIFGNNAIVEQVVQQASRYTGLPAATLQQMLPVIVSIVVGGVGTLMRNQGMGGLLGQLANSGLGGILGQFTGKAAQPGTTAGAGGMGDVFSNILNSFMGGAQHASPQQPGPASRPRAAAVAQPGAIGNAAGDAGRHGCPEQDVPSRRAVEWRAIRRTSAIRSARSSAERNSSLTLRSGCWRVDRWKSALRRVPSRWSRAPVIDRDRQDPAAMTAYSMAVVPSSDNQNRLSMAVSKPSFINCR